ncbi:MAG TPA: hypothetical protein VEL03_06370 [Streptosporangiaceae bacterium]|nr:hypothetical protein [Streptosporangiaceae bacterium]
MTRERWDENVTTVVALSLGAVLVAVVATLIATVWTAAGGGAPASGPVHHDVQASPPGKTAAATVTEATVHGGLGLLLSQGPAGHASSGLAPGASTTGIGNPGRSFAPPLPACGTDQTAVGYAGVVRAGQAAAARQALGSALLAQVRDDTAGQVLDIARTSGGLSRAELARYFSRWRAIYPVARQRQLRSCSYLPTETPAERQVLSAATAAVVRAGFFRSAARLRSVLQIVLISDNPVASHSLIVTLMVPGPAENPTLHGRQGRHPTLHSLVSDTVLMTWPQSVVTGTARGGL